MRPPLKTYAVVLSALLLSAAVRLGAQTQALTEWQFLPDRTGKVQAAELGAIRGWRDARAGLSWNAQFPDLRDYMGIAWYRTMFNLPDQSGRRVLLKFAACDYLCEVFVNGKNVGQHEGGYTPFHFDVTESVRPGANQIAVRVTDPPMPKEGESPPFPDMPYDEIPHGKQNWYVQTGGLWQGVEVAMAPPLYVERIRVTPQGLNERHIQIVFGSAATAETPLAIRITSPSGRVEHRSVVNVAPGRKEHALTWRAQDPLLWSPATPNLYTVEASMPGQTLADRFGFRTFEARDGKLYLNGKPFYMIAALDQDFYPDTIYTAPSEAYVRDQMLKGKRMGLNTLRCHIKVCQPEYLRAADEAGMLVWYEIPSWNDRNHFSTKAAERGEELYAEMTERDWNHPSIVIQGIINESWGANLKDASQRRWLASAYDRAKRSTAPLGRVVPDNSPCCDNFHVVSDLDDFHQYFSIPDNHAKWDKWVADFASRPKWSFSPFGDARRTGREPLIVSEFGNWGLPKLPPKEELPWWFDRDFGGREVTRPAGVHDRFARYGFTALFGDYNRLAEATQWHQFRSLKHEIEEMRSHSSIQGYVITEFTDINWEVNGLMDMWRNPKVYAEELAQIQQPDLVMARTARRSYYANEPVTASVLVSHYGTGDLTNSSVYWWTDSGKSGRLPLSPPVAAGSVASAGNIQFQTATNPSAGVDRIRLQLRDEEGRVVAQNTHELFVYPQPSAAKTRLSFHGQNPTLRRALASAYTVNQLTSAGSSGTLIASIFDERVRQFVSGGGTAVVVLNSKEALTLPLSIQLTGRADSDLDGNWVTNFNWSRADSPPFSAVGRGKLLGFEAVNVIPEFLLQNIPAENYGDVYAGIFYGWLNNNAALALGARVGKGRLFVTTLRFDEYGRDPYATHLLDSIVRYVSSGDFAPRMELK